MAAPTVTSNQTLHTSASLAGGANTTDDLDIRLKFEARIQFRNTGGGTVAATNGLRIEVFRHTNNATTKPDDLGITEFTIVTVVSTEQKKSIALPTGHYRIKATNLDATNAITYEAIFETTDSVA